MEIAFMKELRSRLNSGKLSAIQFRMFCLTVSYQKMLRLKYTKL